MISPDDYRDKAESICTICHLFGDRGWCRATSGNFSVRIDNSTCMITQSGKEKSRLSPEDLMLCDLAGIALDPQLKPSAETLLHTRLYQADGKIAAVLHTHSVNSTMLSRKAGNELVITGFEMQKALSGINSHSDEITIPVFDNTQDISSLADTVLAAMSKGQISVPGFLIRGHGLYAWGRNATEAQRHTEGFEFLFDCLWQEQVVSKS